MQDPTKYRTTVQNKWLETIERLAREREEYSMRSVIIEGDLVMRRPIKKGKRLDPKWDGPFVVVGLTDKDVYRLAGPNGYVLENLVNGQRLRKLSLAEIDEYRGQFWDASQRLKERDQDAKDKREQRDLDRKIKEATMEVQIDRQPILRSRLLLHLSTMLRPTDAPNEFENLL